MHTFAPKEPDHDQPGILVRMGFLLATGVTKCRDELPIVGGKAGTRRIPRTDADSRNIDTGPPEPSLFHQLWPQNRLLSAAQAVSGPSDQTGKSPRKPTWAQEQQRIFLSDDTLPRARIR